MSSPIVSEELEAFPPPPIIGSEILVPITSWQDMFQESKVTQVEFDLFWYDSVEDGIAYFFRWLRHPRSTVLVVWDNNGPTHIECRKIGDLLVSNAEFESIFAEVTRLFHFAGLESKRAIH